MKKILFSLMVVFVSISITDAKNCFDISEAIVVSNHCDSWASGFMDAYETYNGCLDSDDYNTTYNNVLNYCNGASHSQGPGLSN